MIFCLNICGCRGRDGLRLLVDGLGHQGWGSGNYFVIEMYNEVIYNDAYNSVNVNSSSSNSNKTTTQYKQHKQ
jgi:hypothetical protein